MLSALVLLIPLALASPFRRASISVGLALNSQSDTNVPSFGGGLQWYYSYSLSPLSNMDGLEFVPQVWGSSAAMSFEASQIPEGTQYILGFNEPNQPYSVGGSDINATYAAQLHKEWTAQVPSGIQIGAPAVSYGGTQWLSDFFTACDGGCRVDFIPYHFYYTEASVLESYSQSFYSEFQKPMWLTEVACTNYGSTVTNCDASQVESFMKTAFPNFRNSQTFVDRWAWFGAFPTEASDGNANGLENTDGSANAVGMLYASL